MGDAKLVALGKRINAAMDRVEEERAHVKDLFSEAKSAGYIPKMLRKAIARQRMDASKRAEEDSILDLYDHALGNVGRALEAISNGATWDEASKAHGVKRATMARAAAVSKRREVIPTTEAASPGDDAGHRSEPSAPADMGIPMSVNPVPSSGPVGAAMRSGEGEQSGTIPDLPPFLDRRVSA